MKTNWIKLDMLQQISFGNHDYLIALLDGASEEIKSCKSSWKSNQLGGQRQSVFRELHKLKTTFGMLQCGRLIIMSQTIIDQLDQWPSSTIQLDIEELFVLCDEVVEEIDTVIKVKI